jgi:hypothetical protein
MERAAAEIDLGQSRCYDLPVRLELPITQYLSYILRAVAVSILLACFCIPLYAQSKKPKLPDPIKFVNTFDIVANVVHAVLDDMGFKIELEDRKGGRIATRPYEFITGSLTSSEVDKVAVKKDTITGEWLKARYSVEAILEIVSRTETMVTIHTKMEALNRDVDGTEKWVPLESLGTYERRILGKISAKLMGNEQPTEKKGFWGKSPEPVDPGRRFPTGKSW